MIFCCTLSGARQHKSINLYFFPLCIAVLYRTAEEARLAAEARQPPSVVIDRETRRQLLQYFMFRPQDNDMKGDISRRGNDTQQGECDAIDSSGRGARLSKSVRGVFSLLPTLSNPTPDPPPLPGATSPPSALASSLPASPDTEEAGGFNAQESSSAGDCKVPHWSELKSSLLTHG